MGFNCRNRIKGEGVMLALYSHSRRAIALQNDEFFGEISMDGEKKSYSSSLGAQIVTINFAVKYRHAIFENAAVKARAIQSFEETVRAHGERTGLKILSGLHPHWWTLEREKIFF